MQERVAPSPLISSTEFDIPTLTAIAANQQKISSWIVETPVWDWPYALVESLDLKNEIFFKLELFQQTGSFKVRGALTTLLNLNEEALAKGIVAASAGNHAIAVSYAAKIFNTSAKVIMPRTASPVKMQRCKNYGAEVILTDSMTQSFNKMQELAEREGRASIHPFEGHLIALGTATIGLELLQQIPRLDAVIVPIGGGGLIGGIGAAIKQAAPQCLVYGVEPEGSDVMYRSFAAGKPVRLEANNTVAESLAVPSAMPYSFDLCHRFVDQIVHVSDSAIEKAEVWMFYETKLAVEPAAAAALAALCGPLKEPLQGKRVALIVSGTNIDVDRYFQIVQSELRS